MTQIQLARMLLMEIEAVRDHKGDMIDLLTLTNEVFKDAEKLANKVLHDHPIETIEEKNS